MVGTVDCLWVRISLSVLHSFCTLTRDLKNWPLKACGQMNSNDMIKFPAITLCVWCTWVFKLRPKQLLLKIFQMKNQITLTSLSSVYSSQLTAKPIFKVRNKGGIQSRTASRVLLNLLEASSRGSSLSWERRERRKEVTILGLAHAMLSSLLGSVILPNNGS